MTTVRVTKAGEGERATIATLMTPYLAELGESTDYEYLPRYWSEPESRFPYLLEAGAAVVGFALVRRTGPADTFEMAEFYITPEFRAGGAGRSAVEQLLRRHPGHWTIEVARNNSSGRAFWTTVPNGCSSDVSEVRVGESRVAFGLRAVDHRRCVPDR